MRASFTAELVVKAQVVVLLATLASAWPLELRNSSSVRSNLANRRFTLARSAKPAVLVDHPTIDGIDAKLLWGSVVRGERLGAALVLKKGEKFVEYAVLYEPNDGSFVVKGLLDATGYMGELRVLRNREALANINSTHSQGEIVFKLDTPRIVSEKETSLILSVLSTLPPFVVQLSSVAVSFKIPKQKTDAVLEITDLSRNGSETAVVNVVRNTISVTVNDLPPQTVVRVVLRRGPTTLKARTAITMFLFTGSVTKIAERAAQVVASATKLGIINSAFKRPTVTCYVKNKPPFQGFPCHNSNICIPLNWECDGDEDCDGGYDEDGCRDGLSAYTHQYLAETNGNNFASGSCKRGEFECPRRGINVCLPTSWLCDGRVDCSNGWDENQRNCGGTGYSSNTNYHLVYKQCGRSQYRCRKGGCVTQRQLCDGRRDCRDGSDEDDCTEDVDPDDEDVDEANNCDPEYEYLCSGPRRKCVPRTWVCDDQDDCPDGEDEGDDVCNSHFHNFND